MYPAISDNDVVSATSPLLPLPEQRLIVAKVDSLTGKSSRTRTSRTRKLIGLTSPLAKAFKG